MASLLEMYSKSVLAVTLCLAKILKLVGKWRPTVTYFKYCNYSVVIYHEYCSRKQPKYCSATANAISGLVMYTWSMIRLEWSRFVLQIKQKSFMAQIIQK